MDIRRRVRMVDVAQAAGVSRTTASFVLNGRDVAIPSETRQRVLKAARLMGYRRHATAVALATGRTQRVGVVLNEPDSFVTGDPYFSQVLAGITRAALRRNYNLLLHSSQHTDPNALSADIQSGATDGVLLVGRYADDYLTPVLLDGYLPTVCVSYHVAHPRCHSVDCDNEMGAWLAIQHLLSLGHRCIALFYPGEGVSWGRERHGAAIRAVTEAGLDPSVLRVFEWAETAPPRPEWCRDAIAFLRGANPAPTAALFCEESRARMLVETLPDNGIRVPDDLAVVSFNSTEYSLRSRPPMTSVRQPLEAIGSAALEMLLDLVEGHDVPERHVRLPVRLDIRESSGTVRPSIS